MIELTGAPPEIKPIIEEFAEGLPKKWVVKWDEEFGGVTITANLSSLIILPIPYNITDPTIRAFTEWANPCEVADVVRGSIKLRLQSIIDEL